jgi:two-component system, OmpR family, response regulator ChvI
MQNHESRSEDRRRKRILFVNDDVDTTAVIKEGLSMHGYEVEVFVDSNLALQNFKKATYDLLLLDVRMRGLNGFELYNQLRKIDKNIQICFISASNTFYEKYKRLYPEVQEECYIEKPLGIKKLASIIDKVLN